MSVGTVRRSPTAADGRLEARPARASRRSVRPRASRAMHLAAATLLLIGGLHATDGGRGSTITRLVAAAPPAQSTPPAGRRKLFPPQDLGLLSAPDRDDWSKPDVIMDALAIADGAVVADLGAGGGWFSIRLARRVGPNGVVYAQDIQPQMIEAINKRVQQEGLSNVRTVLGTPTDPRLPGGLDAVLIVDAYHEMDDPLKPDVIQGLLRDITRSLKPQGRVGIVDFLPGSGGPGPAADDRVNPDTIIPVVEAAGLRLQSRETIPPFQYLLVFEKVAPPAAAPKVRRRS